MPRPLVLLGLGTADYFQHPVLPERLAAPLLEAASPRHSPRQVLVVVLVSVYFFKMPQWYSLLAPAAGQASFTAKGHQLTIQVNL